MWVHVQGFRIWDHQRPFSCVVRVCEQLFRLKRRCESEKESDRVWERVCRRERKIVREGECSKEEVCWGAAVATHMHEQRIGFTLHLQGESKTRVKVQQPLGQQQRVGRRPGGGEQEGRGTQRRGGVGKSFSFYVFCFVGNAPLARSFAARMTCILYLGRLSGENESLFVCLSRFVSFALAFFLSLSLSLSARPNEQTQLQRRKGVGVLREKKPTHTKSLKLCVQGSMCYKTLSAPAYLLQFSENDNWCIICKWIFTLVMTSLKRPHDRNLRL